MSDRNTADTQRLAHCLVYVSAQYVTPAPGPIIDLLTGKTLGTHRGLWSYTIGQGARVKGMPQKMFVVKKDVQKNEIYVVPGS